MPFATILEETPIKELAETPLAKFEYWIQDKFNVLPTDPRFTDLTEEQLDLLYAHRQRENAPDRNPAYTDSDYDREEADAEGYNAQEAKGEGRLPIQDFESYKDPDFDDEWNAEDGEDDSDIVGENPPESGSNDFDPEEERMEFDPNDWEEV